MILQALYELYKKLADDHANGLPMPGCSLQRISFKVVLHPDGRLHEISAVKDAAGRAIPTLVPGAGKPSGEAINPASSGTIAAICSASNPKIRSLSEQQERSKRFGGTTSNLRQWSVRHHFPPSAGSSKAGCRTERLNTPHCFRQGPVSEYSRSQENPATFTRMMRFTRGGSPEHQLRQERTACASLLAANQL